MTKVIFMNDKSHFQADFKHRPLIVKTEVYADLSESGTYSPQETCGFSSGQWRFIP
jgi:hypothetical protein